MAEQFWVLKPKPPTVEAKSPLPADITFDYFCADAAASGTARTAGDTHQ